MTSTVVAHCQTYQWAKNIGGPTANSVNISNSAHGVAVDGAGNVYTTGHFLGSNVDFNPGLSPVSVSSGSANAVFVAKYSPGGSCSWARAIPTVGDGLSVATDVNGNVYITGQFSGTGIDFDPGPGVALLNSVSFDLFIAKYDAGGNYLWATAIGGSGVETSRSISLDATGNVYITGYFQSPVMDFDPGPGVANRPSAGGNDFFVAKYDSNGAYLWANTVGGTGTDISNGIGTDAAGNAYITGYFNGVAIDFDPGPGTATLSSVGQNIFLAKYDGNGNYLWAKTIPSVFAVANAITADSQGNIHITGNFVGQVVDFDPGPATATLTSGPTSTSSAMFIAKYNTNGGYVWADAVQGDAIGNSIANNAAGKVFVTGYYFNNNNQVSDFDPGPTTATLALTGNNADVFFAKYDANGAYIWAKGISNPSNMYSYAIATDGIDNAYISGSFYGANVNFNPAPGTSTVGILSATQNYNMYLAKYGYCSVPAASQKTICPGVSYFFNGHVYSQAGNYTDTLYTSFGCDSIVHTQLSMAPQPTVNIVSSAALCVGSTSTLSASGAATYTWASGTQSPFIVVTPSVVMQYLVSGTDGNGCISNNSISVSAAPTVTITGRLMVCKGDKVLMTAMGANSYTWNSGLQTPTISATVNNTTIYSVTASFTDTPCLSKQTVTVNVVSCLGLNSSGAPLQASIYPNPAKTELFYTVNSTDVHHYSIWDFNGRLIADGEQRTNKVSIDLNGYAPGIYYLKITINKVSTSTKFLIE